MTPHQGEKNGTPPLFQTHIYMRLVLNLLIFGCRIAEKTHDPPYRLSEKWMTPHMHSLKNRRPPPHILPPPPPPLKFMNSPLPRTALSTLVYCNLTMLCMMSMSVGSDCGIQLMFSLSMWFMDSQLLLVQCTSSYFHAVCMFSVRIGRMLLM